jgi:hypothetical protein
MGIFKTRPNPIQEVNFIAERSMPADRQALKNKRMEAAKRIVRASRLHWLQQILDWPLETGSIAGRLSETEIAALRKAAENGKLFFGSSE